MYQHSLRDKPCDTTVAPLARVAVLQWSRVARIKLNVRVHALFLSNNTIIRKQHKQQHKLPNHTSDYFRPHSPSFFLITPSFFSPDPLSRLPLTMSDIDNLTLESISVSDLDRLALADSADGVVNHDEKLDLLAEWIFSDDRDAWEAAEASAAKKEAAVSKRLATESENLQLAEALFAQVARDVQAATIQAVS